MSGRHRRADQPTGSRRRPVMIAVAAVVVAGLAVWLSLALTGGDDHRPTAGGLPSIAPTTAPPVTTSSAAPSSTPVASTAPTATTTTTTRTPSPPATTTRRPARPAPTLVVRADRGDSWLVVRDAAGRQRYNALLPRGRTQRFDGPFFSVVLGDAAVVDVLVNGDHRPRGRPGQVERFTVRGR